MTTYSIRREDPLDRDSDRLALLWRAFEEAEQRIGELERDLDRARQVRVSPASVGPAPGARAPAAPPQEAVEARLRESHEREARLVAELAEARRTAEAEAARYVAAIRVIQHEAANARHAAAERDAANVSLRDARARLAVLDAERVAMAEERGRLHADVQELETELADTRMSLQRAEARYALEELGREIDAAVSRAKSMQDAKARADVAASPVPAPAAVPSVSAAPPRAPRAYAPTRLYPVAPGRVGLIPGIHAHEVEGLRRAGVNMMDALLYADLAALAAVSDVGLPRLARHRSLAELIALDGIGPEWAERLFRAGVRGIEDVSEMDAARLESTLMGSYDEEGLSEEARTLLARTLPARSEAVVREAREVVARWQGFR